MRTRVKTKAVKKAKNFRCPKCNKLLRKHTVRCKTCHLLIKK